MRIKDIKASKRLSSLGHFTIHLDMLLDDNTASSIGIPYGISAGKYEAGSIPAEEAIVQIESVKSQLLSEDWEQETLDRKLIDLKLAGNVSIAISVAFWKATFDIKKQENLQFPQLCMLLFEGGMHANTKITFQEFMVIEKSLETAISDSQKMRKYLHDQNIETTVGAEGGFSPKDFENKTALETISQVFPDRKIAIDAAGSFQTSSEGYDELLQKYDIYYLEDPYSDESWEEWTKTCEKQKEKMLIVGDDLTVTNPKRIQEAIEKNAINAVVIKPNQNGTITGALEAVRLARENNFKIVVSHRGEETNDDWIVDFALSTQADYVKFGGVNRGERIAKYNRLLELGMK